jgi:hypothetical protein
VILDQIHGFLARFIAYPSDHAHLAHTLWVAHTHVMDAWDSTPRLAFLSPEPGSGKTRALEITELLVPNAVEAVNVTPAYLFRKVGDDKAKPTILFDEIDTIFGPRAKDNEEIRGLLNAGHRQGAMAGRCVVKGKVVTTEEIPAYCAVALAGIGDLPDTVLTRSITVKMRRRAPTEYIEPYRRRIHAPEGEKLRVELARWTSAHESRLSEAWPEMPSGIVDREADVWEPLLAVADAAGEEWPELARFAARALVTEARESPASMGIRLLSDLFEIFNGHEVMSTDDLLKALHGVEESPWDDLYGKPLNPRGLSQRLRKYEVSSKTVRLPVGTAKGYARADLWDVWQRYTPELIRDGSVTDVTDDGSSLVAASSRDVTDVTDVTHSSGGGHSEQPAFDDEVIF